MVISCIHTNDADDKCVNESECGNATIQSVGPRGKPECVQGQLKKHFETPSHLMHFFLSLHRRTRR